MYCYSRACNKVEGTRSNTYTFPLFVTGRVPASPLLLTDIAQSGLSPLRTIMGSGSYVNRFQELRVLRKTAKIIFGALGFDTPKCRTTLDE